MRFLAVALLATACGALPSDDPGDPATRAARAFAASSTALMGTSMGEPGQVKTQPTASCSAAWLPHVSASASRHMLTGATGSATFAVERGDGVVTARASFSSFTLAPMTEGFTFDGELDYYGTRVTLDISTQELTLDGCPTVATFHLASDESIDGCVSICGQAFMVSGSAP